MRGGEARKSASDRQNSGFAPWVRILGAQVRGPGCATSARAVEQTPNPKGTGAVLQIEMLPVDRLGITFMGRASV
jgi:hypothetical protein